MQRIRRDFHSIIAVFVVGFIGGMILFTIMALIAGISFWFESLVLSSLLGFLLASLLSFRLYYQQSFVKPKSLERIQEIIDNVSDVYK